MPYTNFNPGQAPGIENLDPTLKSQFSDISPTKLIELDLLEQADNALVSAMAACDEMGWLDNQIEGVTFLTFQNAMDKMLKWIRTNGRAEILED